MAYGWHPTPSTRRPGTAPRSQKRAPLSRHRRARKTTDAASYIVVDLLEGLPAVREVARVDADLVVGLAGDHGRFPVEVHVGHEGDVHALGVELLADLEAIFCLSDALDGEAHHVRAGLLASQDLFDRRLDVVRVRRAHGLQHDGVGGAYPDLPDFHGRRRASLRLFVVGAVAAYCIRLFAVGGAVDRRL